MKNITELVDPVEIDKIAKSHVTDVAELGLFVANVLNIKEASDELTNRIAVIAGTLFAMGYKRAQEEK